MTIQAIRGKRIVTPEGIRAATVHLHNGVIEAVSGYNNISAGKNIYDAGSSVVMPGFVDTHVHIDEPGRTEWEGFETATRAAAAGGVTTLVDMPLNSIPATTTAAALETKRKAARKKCWVNVGFWGGVVPGNADEICVRSMRLERWASSVFWCHRAWMILRTLRKRTCGPPFQCLPHWMRLCSFMRSCRDRSKRRAENWRSQSSKVQDMAAVTATQCGDQSGGNDDSTGA